MEHPITHKKHLTSFRVIILGFASVIILGAIFLMLPISSKEGISTPFHQALFTSTSAVCVTGLVLKDTASYWSTFGQVIILTLIQIGGMGVITVAASIALISGRKISLMQRSTIQEAIAAPKMGGIVKLTGFIIKAIFLFELIGTLIMLPVFCSDFGFKGIWISIFHSISAFCNAGFDIMGTTNEPFVSLTNYVNNPLVNLTVISLIVIGGIGFLTWDDIRANRYHFHRYRMQSKVILVTTIFLIIIPTLYLFFFEFNELPLNDRLLGSLFQAVTPRTAGFNTINLANLSDAGQCILIVLMLIGGSPGSTAGGMKTTTFAILLATVISVFKNTENPQFFGRRIDSQTLKRAFTLFILYLTLFLFSGLLISQLESLPLSYCLFETASAIGTVGLTLGITPMLSTLSQYILIGLMFLGRVGGLTLIYATLTPRSYYLSKLPKEKITVG